MRVAFLRSDVSRLYLDDIENSSQRCFSSEPAGQSRYFHQTTDAELLAVLNGYAFLTKVGSVAAATFATNGVATDNKINVKTSSSAAFTQIAVTIGGAVPIATVVADLNAGFLAAGLGLTARNDGSNHVAIDTTAKGPTAYFEISAASPSAGTLHTILGIATTALTGLSVAALNAAVYVGVTAIAGQTGAAATITAVSGRDATVGGLTGMTSASVGRALTLTGFGDAGNVGTFRITRYISATSVVIENAAAVLDSSGDTWTEYATIKVDVSTATVGALSTFAGMAAAPKAAVVLAVADAVAPTLIETGPVLLSFAYGKLSKLRSATFVPGGPQAATIARLNYPVGAAVSIVGSDGTTAFSL